jgi:hypothetical protein
VCCLPSKKEERRKKKEERRKKHPKTSRKWIFVPVAAFFADQNLVTRVCHSFAISAADILKYLAPFANPLLYASPFIF